MCGCRPPFYPGLKDHRVSEDGVLEDDGVLVSRRQSLTGMRPTRTPSSSRSTRTASRTARPGSPATACAPHPPLPVALTAMKAFLTVNVSISEGQGHPPPGEGCSQASNCLTVHQGSVPCPTSIPQLDPDPASLSAKGRFVQLFLHLTTNHNESMYLLLFVTISVSIFPLCLGAL